MSFRVEGTPKSALLKNSCGSCSYVFPMHTEEPELSR